MNKRILLFLKLPPPLTGATLMNSFVEESRLISSNFKKITIPLSYKENLSDRNMFSTKKIKTILWVYYKLLSVIINFKPELIYFQISPLGIAFYRDCTYLFLMKIFKKKILLHMHGKGIDECVKDSRLKRAIYKWAFKNTFVICLSENLKSDLAKVYFGIPYIVNNSIKYNPGVTINRQDKDVINILFLSNLILSKGIFDYLEAFEILSKKTLRNKYRGIIVGKEVELSKEEIAFEIKKRDLERIVKYLGPKYEEEKNEILKETNILVFPTCNDVWGLVILEAMQFGIPVIATKEGAIPEVLNDGLTGFLIDKNKPDQIAEKLELLINDTELRQRIGSAGRAEFLKKYTLDVFEYNINEVFVNVINEKV